MPACRAPIDHLKPGVFISLELKWHEHPFVFNRFKIKSRDQIKVLKELGLTEVTFVPEKSDSLPSPPRQEPGIGENGELPTTVSQPEDMVTATSHAGFSMTKQKQVEKLEQRHQRLQVCEKRYEKTLGQVKRVMQDLATGSEDATIEADRLIHNIVDSFLTDQESIVHLMNAKIKDENAFYHSLNVVVLSLLLAKEYGLGARDGKLLGLGALFHDIGKQRIPKSLIYKQGPLTGPEKKLLRLHPAYGFDMMSKIEWFHEEALKIIRQHHEKNDGNGYPDGIQGDEITLLARIAAIANTYDNLCNRIEAEQSLTPYEALSFMFRNKGLGLDEQLLTMFIRCLGVYPPGTIVRLSNEVTGIVISANPGRHLHPSVLIYDPDVPKKEAIIIDLDEDPDIKIERSLRPSQLSPEVYAYLDPRSRVSYFMDSERDVLRTRA